MTEDVARQTEREKQLQKRYADLVEELKELSKENRQEAVYKNGNADSEVATEVEVEA